MHLWESYEGFELWKRQDHIHVLQELRFETTVRKVTSQATIAIIKIEKMGGARSGGCKVINGDIFEDIVDCLIDFNSFLGPRQPRIEHHQLCLCCSRDHTHFRQLEYLFIGLLLLQLS